MAQYKNQLPRYPESHWCQLPHELLLYIVMLAASEVRNGKGHVYRRGVDANTLQRINIHNQEIQHVACGCSHAMALSTGGVVYCHGSQSYGARGRVQSEKSGDNWNVEQSILAKAVQVERIYAGYYYTLAVCHSA
eukprot:TRINITY_DN856_c0_g1_i7.p1 TRINITY_DN856_c0_g1~~TRINITY_DN856_c0_g1_i7.p1  ORF type:complete len:135 (-),score=7.26 TRINITY_DN856_c0_g1_i7:247-651(-)